MLTRLMNLMRNPRKCAEVRELMSDYLDDDASVEDRRRVHRHVRWCRPCRRVLGNLRLTLGRLSGLAELRPPAAEDEHEVGERVAASWRERA
jgi:predicted anti-sigma-YlaC factor YlaD